MNPLRSNCARSSRRWIAAALAALTQVTCVAAAPQREWHTLAIDGQRVGYAWHEVRNTLDERIDSQVMRIHVSQLRRVTVVEISTEMARSMQGAPRWIRVSTLNGANRSGWNGVVTDDGRSMLVTGTDTSRARKVVSLPPDLQWPDESPEASGSKRSRTGSGRPVLDTGNAAVTMPGTNALGSGERSFYGTTLQWSPCSTNCDARVDKPFDLMARLVVASPYRIPANALDGPLRYVISRTDGTPSALPTTGEQSVIANGLGVVVTICNTCGTREVLSDADRSRYLASNPWVQSDHIAVQRFAHSAGKGTPRQVMQRLVDAVRMHMNGEIDYLGYASASRALATRSGDCTEFSVLLAAAARAQGIPTRIASGLVYAARFSGKKDVFSPHTWVQAWTGERWESFDAGLEAFDATHIALAIGDGDPRTASAATSAGQWRIEKLGLVK